MFTTDGAEKGEGNPANPPERFRTFRPHNRDNDGKLQQLMRASLPGCLRRTIVWLKISETEMNEKTS